MKKGLLGQQNAMPLHFPKANGNEGSSGHFDESKADDDGVGHGFQLRNHRPWRCKPWSQLSERRQQQLLKKGCSFLRGEVFPALRNIVWMLDNQGEPASLDQLLRELLEYGIERVRPKEARMALIKDMIPAHMVLQIEKE